MIYVGVVSELLSIDQSAVEKAIGIQFAGKQKAIDLNLTAVRLGAEWTRENLTEDDPFVVEPMNETAGKIIVDGNTAAAIGSMFAGVSVVCWYPITPSTSICESLIDYLQEYRIDQETGKATYAVIQAEDELASIGMALGAGWAGLSMTTSAGDVTDG